MNKPITFYLLFYFVTFAGGLFLLCRGMAARKNKIKKQAGASLALGGVSCSIWSILGAIYALNIANSWIFITEKNQIGGISIGIFLSMFISGQYKLLKKEPDAKDSPTNEC
jgi:hypothetical protein